MLCLPRDPLEWGSQIQEVRRSKPYSGKRWFPSREMSLLFHAPFPPGYGCIYVNEWRGSMHSPRNVIMQCGKFLFPVI